MDDLILVAMLKVRINHSNNGGVKPKEYEYLASTYSNKISNPNNKILQSLQRLVSCSL